MMITLVFFALGSVWATAHIPEFWARLPQLTGIPSIPGTLLIREFGPHWRLSARDVLTAVLGGLLMGYGARLAHGCNIGAFLGGIVYGSMHGWWWMVWGFAGSLVGTRLRGALAMDPPLPPRRAPA